MAPATMDPFDPMEQLTQAVERAERCADRAAKCAASVLTASPEAAAIDARTANDTAASAVQQKNSALAYAEMVTEPIDAMDLVSRALTAADRAINAAMSATIATTTSLQEG